VPQHGCPPTPAASHSELFHCYQLPASAVPGNAGKGAFGGASVALGTRSAALCGRIPSTGTRFAGRWLLSRQPGPQPEGSSARSRCISWPSVPVALCCCSLSGWMEWHGRAGASGGVRRRCCGACSVSTLVHEHLCVDKPSLSPLPIRWLRATSAASCTSAADFARFSRGFVAADGDPSGLMAAAPAGTGCGRVWSRKGPDGASRFHQRRQRTWGACRTLRRRLKSTSGCR
jgi:hypothetical protein